MINQLCISWWKNTLIVQGFYGCLKKFYEIYMITHSIYIKCFKQQKPRIFWIILYLSNRFISHRNIHILYSIIQMYSTKHTIDRYSVSTCYLLQFANVIEVHPKGTKFKWNKKSTKNIVTFCFMENIRETISKRITRV